VGDVPAAVEVAVDAVGDALLREDGVGAAPRDGVDGRLDVLQPRHRPQREAVVHRDDDVAAVRPEAFQSRGGPCGHVT